MKRAERPDFGKFVGIALITAFLLELVGRLAFQSLGRDDLYDANGNWLKGVSWLLIAVWAWRYFRVTQWLRERGQKK